MNDFSPTTSSLLLVHNRAGVSMPFSIDVLATSLLVTGIQPPDAYAIASRLGESLQLEGHGEVDSGQVADRAAELLEALVGPAEAARFRAWRQFRHLGRPLVLCLLGAPGVGKATLATSLAMRLGIHRVLPTEAVREVLRTVVAKSVLPELHLAAHEAVTSQKAPMGDGFLRQAAAVNQAAAAVAARSVAEGRNVLLVGAHLVPGGMRQELQQRGSSAVIVELLLTLADEKLHRARLLRRARCDPAMPGVRHLKHFPAVRALQDQLCELARANGVVRHEVGSEKALVEWVVDHTLAAAGLSNETG